MAALLVDCQDTVKGSGRDVQPLGYGNIVFHILVHLVTADHKYVYDIKRAFNKTLLVCIFYS